VIIASLPAHLLRGKALWTCYHPFLSPFDKLGGLTSSSRHLIWRHGYSRHARPRRGWLKGYRERRALALGRCRQWKSFRYGFWSWEFIRRRCPDVCSLAITSGRVVQFQTLEDNGSFAPSAKKIRTSFNDFDSAVIQIVANTTAFTALTKSNTVYTWGEGRIPERLGRQVSEDR
jgi:hypothetical protein